MVRVTISNQRNQRIAEIEPTIELVSWILNTYGEARFFLPFTSPKCTTEILALGNRVQVDFESGLPSFYGIIDVPRRVDSTGVHIMAFSAERIFSWRECAKTASFENTSPGTIYQSLISAANASWDMGIGIGEIRASALKLTEIYHYQALSSIFEHLALKSGEDFAVIDWLADWYERRGIDKRNSVALIEGSNATGIVLDESDRIASDIKVLGAGDTWDAGRLVGVATSWESRNAYDMREYTIVDSDLANNQTILDNVATVMLREYESPKIRLSMTALDATPGKFEAYDLGDIVRCQAFCNGGLWGVDGAYRVVGREWYPNNSCRVELIKWTN